MLPFGWCRGTKSVPNHPFLWGLMRHLPRWYMIQSTYPPRSSVGGARGNSTGRDVNVPICALSDAEDEREQVSARHCLQQIWWSRSSSEGCLLKCMAIAVTAATIKSDIISIHVYQACWSNVTQDTAAKDPCQATRECGISHASDLPDKKGNRSESTGFDWEVVAFEVWSCSVLQVVFPWLTVVSQPYVHAAMQYTMHVVSYVASQVVYAVFDAA